jgi:ketopantoate reductase
MIYIVGESPLACYMAARLQDSGKNVAIVSGQKENLSLGTNGIMLKEEHSLRKKACRFQTAPFLKEEPELLIIAAGIRSLNARLTAVSGRLIKNCPILLFTPLMNIDYIEQILGSSVIRAYCDGYIIENGQTVSVLGRAPSFCLSGNPKKKPVKTALSLLEPVFPVSIEENGTRAFWNFFAAHALGLVFSGAYRQNLAALLKNPDRKEELKLLAREIETLAAKELAEINREELLGRLYAAPANYVWPVSSAWEQNAVCQSLSELSQKHRLPVPQLNGLIKKIYINLA